MKPNLTTWGTESEKNQGLLHTEINGEIIKEKISTLQGNYYDFFEKVYQSIANHKPEPVTAQDGINVMQIIEGAIQSSKQMKAIIL